MAGRWLVLLAVALGLCGPARAEPYPQDAGILNVRDFGARGNGRDDDTAAILRAIAASGQDTGLMFWQDRIVYLPAGTYLVSDTLLKRYRDGRFGSGLALVGDGPTATTIRLADRARGFGDPGRPRAVVFTTSKLLRGAPDAGNKDYLRRGEGNDAYMNYVEDLTVDVGRGNPGAVALDFLGNNIGAVRNVILRAPADSGAVGLSMTRKWPGPTLIQNLTVKGFGVGIDVAQTEYGLTFDRIILIDQRRSAVRNRDNALAMREVAIRGPAPAIVNAGAKAFMAIDGATVGGAGGWMGLTPLIENEGVMRLRGVRLETHRDRESERRSADTLHGVLEGSRWQPSAPEYRLPPTADSLRAPRVPVDEWVSVAAFGATGSPDEDATEGLRRAFASGAAVIYLPNGVYSISDTVAVPGTVRRIVGFHSTIQTFAPKRRGFIANKPMMRVAQGGEPLFIERLAFEHSNLGPRVAIEHAGPRDVTVRDVVGAGVMLMDRRPTGGRAFLENTCCGRFRFAGPQPVFARQLDTEGGGVRIVNNGSPLWILGLKTEGVATVVDNRHGARTDIFGGLVYMVRDGADHSVPVFMNSGAWLTASFAEESLRPASRYSAFLAQDGRAVIRAEDLPARGFGRFVPALTAVP